MKLFGYTIVKEKPGVISPGACWVIFYGAWMHTGGSLLGTIWNVIIEYKNDRHLVG